MIHVQRMRCVLGGKKIKGACVCVLFSIDEVV